MLAITTNQLKIYQFETLRSLPELAHFVSTRVGGSSDSQHGSLNLGLHVGDEPSRVLENRSLLSGATSVPLHHMVFCQQAHGAHVASVGPEFRGRGSLNSADGLPATDAMVTDADDVCLVVLVADCIPVLIFDPSRRVVAAVHAGWRGTAKRVVHEAVRHMTQRFGSNPSDLVAGIGPSIGPSCYEVGTEVVGAIESAGLPLGSILKPAHNGKAFLDLWQAVRLQLLDAGLEQSRIETAGMCTHCRNDDFFSARRENGTTGRFAVGICLISPSEAQAPRLAKTAA